MKALIFNSGLGSRMGTLTKDKPKAMLRLPNGETIFERQIRILSDCGITEFVVTLGYLKEQIIKASESFSGIRFEFVYNPQYETTNYIYSMYLAKSHIDGDMLILHGDLVFNKELIVKILADKEKTLCLYNEKLPLSEKDFKGRVQNGLLKEVSVNIFDSDCFAFQPLYKLSKDIAVMWVNQVERFVKRGEKNVYAENALNQILDNTEIRAFSYNGDYITEVDNMSDYTSVCAITADKQSAYTCMY
ncbi:nucleotidyltransferase [Clostridia bacterium]|nr:nucleotidyltransferase [Clostridia bacterium]GHU57966.1 nucleotidyltransferase [Clostridia bacterium]